MPAGHVARWPAALLVSLLAPMAAAADERPMYYLESFGPRGQSIAHLTWGVLILAIAVIVIISVLVLIAVFKRHGRSTGGRRIAGSAAHSPESYPPVSRSPGGLPWIFFGLALTAVILVGFTIWTVRTMAGIKDPPTDPRLTIEITAQQWWWEARYEGEEPYRSFETANEIHIPVGEPVRLKLKSQDVIHSFWVPALSGKTDLIPGQVNETWIQADRAGVYRGQCAEFCGRQHANMALRLFADPPEVFEAWREAQLEPADPPETELARLGHDQFILRCGACHTVRGTRAGGEIGPDLTHLMARTSIAAVMLPNTVGHLSGWIANPQVIKPESRMPNLDLSGPDLASIRSYLVTLE